MLNYNQHENYNFFSCHGYILLSLVINLIDLFKIDTSNHLLTIIFKNNYYNYHNLYVGYIICFAEALVVTSPKNNAFSIVEIVFVKLMAQVEFHVHKSTMHHVDMLTM